VICVLAIAGSLFGCASNPAAPDRGVVEEEFRDADFDVMFATEFPVTSKADALLRADEALQAGELDRALFFFVKALRFTPDDAELLLRIGQMHEYRHDKEMAVRAYTVALKFDPDLVPALENRGLLLLGNNEFDRAEQDLIRAVAQDLDAWRAYNGLGLIADSRKQHDKAFEFYTAALAANPDAAIVLNNRGYSRMLANKSSSAEADLRQSAELGYEKAWLNLGKMFAGIGNYDEAINMFSKVLPEPDALTKTAETAIENQDFEIARTMLRRAIESSPVYLPSAEQILAQID
jgi:tetratricopeptide (TPR) repeat protein